MELISRVEQSTENETIFKDCLAFPMDNGISKNMRQKLQAEILMCKLID